MDRARDQFLSGAAFAANQDSRFGGRNSADELIDLPDPRALAHHVVLDVDFFLETLVLTLKPFDIPHMLQSHGSDGGDGRQEMEVMLIEARSRVHRVRVDDAEL